MNQTPTKAGITLTIQTLCQYKETMEKNCREMLHLQEINESISEEVLIDWNSSPLQIDRKGIFSEEWKKEINRRVWLHMVKILHLERYMLCSEYSKLIQEIEKDKVPEFSFHIIILWVENIKSLIYENLEKLIKKVFQEITTGHYSTKPSWNAPRKKRNNNGIDNYFILSTYDYSIRSWRRPTITDDLEKVIYLLAGEPLPNPNLKARMEKKDVKEMATPYFRVKFCKNGNTHYWITDEKILDKLNRIGSGDSSLIGEKIKIKIMEK